MTSQSVWSDVSAAEPCQVCGKPDWCSSSDSALICRRESTHPTLGEGEHKKDRTGSEYFLFRLATETNYLPQKEQADPETLDRIYTALLRKLPLMLDGMKELGRRGLDPNSVQRLRLNRNYGFLGIKGRAAIAADLINQGLEEELARVPGFIVKQNERGIFWTIAGRAGLLIPVRDVEGRIVAVIVRATDDGNGGRYRYLSSKKHGGAGPGSPVHVPLHKKHHETVRVTEGCLKADLASVASKVLTLGLPGIASWRRAAGVLKKLGATRVLVAFDADWRTNVAVANALACLVRHLVKNEFKVAVEVWKLSQGKGIDDVLLAGHSPEVLENEDIDSLLVEVDRVAKNHTPKTKRRMTKSERIARAAELADADSVGTSSANGTAASNYTDIENGIEDDDGLPEIDYGFDESQVTSRYVDLLGELGWFSDEAEAEELERSRVYQRGRVLVHVVRDSHRKTGKGSESAWQIRAMPKAIVRERMTQVARLTETVTKGDEVSVEQRRPPEHLVQAIHQRGDYGSAIPQLTGITESPCLRHDGSVLQQPGYDEATGLIFKPDIDFPQIPDHPTQADAEKAAAELLEVISDFPFESPAHRSIWVAIVLTLLARPAISGPCPLFVFDANTRGCGKTLLADVAGIIAQGSPMPRKAQPNHDEELGKLISSVALEAWPSMLVDNVARTLGGPSLDAALTGTTWQDRVLGESRTTGKLPLTTVWIATGNNVEIAADTARRVLLGRLDSPDENPEDRIEFRHPDLKKWVTENRGRLVVAGLTLLRAYYVAGRPNIQIPAWGSFEAWSDVIRQSMVFAGLPDPWETHASVRNVDRSAENLRLLHSGIEEADLDCAGLTAAEIERLLSRSISEDNVDPYPTLREAVAEICGPKITARTIGYALRNYRGRVCGGKRLVAEKARGGVNRWKIEAIAIAGNQTPSPPSGGDGGNGCDESSQSRSKEPFTYEL